jgi:putative transposase
LAYNNGSAASLLINFSFNERFNSSFRRELLDAHLFRSLAQVRQLVDEWRHDYNTQQPHQALNFMTPLEFKQAA